MQLCTPSKRPPTPTPTVSRSRPRLLTSPSNKLPTQKRTRKRSLPTPLSSAPKPTSSRNRRKQRLSSSVNKRRPLVSALLAGAYANLSNALGGPSGLTQYMMIKEGVYTDLAKANAEAVRGLAPKMTIWKTGAEASGQRPAARGAQGGAAAIRNIHQMLPPLMTTIQEQTGVSLPACNTAPWRPRPTRERSLRSTARGSMATSTKRFVIVALGGFSSRAFRAVFCKREIFLVSGWVEGSLRHTSGCHCNSAAFLVSGWVRGLLRGSYLEVDMYLYYLQ